ncbi:MAG: hypothetical protein JNL38_13665 [Myxococcales bacterium]|nr:hypothetical protein [Myxococcales bacterium]
MIVATGAGAAIREAGTEDDVLPFLKSKKSRKFMGIQDELAVTAAGRALGSAGLAAIDHARGAAIGLFATVGYIPFESADIDPVLEGSLVGGEFDVAEFSREGYLRAHPLLTFRCLPNMPAFHVSVSFGLRGPYLVTYPGPGQTYAALEEAVFALESGACEVALVLAVAHQKNFLVEHHFARVDHPVPADRLADAAACVVLETASGAAARGAPARAELRSVNVQYTPFSALAATPTPAERLTGAELDPREIGPAGMLLSVARALAPSGRARATLTHGLATRDGVRAESVWEVVP